MAKKPLFTQNKAALIKAVKEAFGVHGKDGWKKLSQYMSDYERKQVSNKATIHDIRRISTTSEKVVNEMNKIGHLQSGRIAITDAKKKSIYEVQNELNKIRDTFKDLMEEGYKGAPGFKGVNKGHLAEIMRMAVVGTVVEYDHYDITADYMGGDDYVIDEKGELYDIQKKTEGGYLRLGYTFIGFLNQIKYLKGSVVPLDRLIEIAIVLWNLSEKGFKISGKKGTLEEKLNFVKEWVKLTGSQWIVLTFSSHDYFDVAIKVNEFEGFVEAHPHLFDFIPSDSRVSTHKMFPVDFQFKGARSIADLWAIGKSARQGRAFIIHDIPVMFYHRRGVALHRTGQTKRSVMPRSPESGYTVRDIDEYNSFIDRRRNEFDMFYQRYGGYGMDGWYVRSGY